MKPIIANNRKINQLISQMDDQSMAKTWVYRRVLERSIIIEISNLILIVGHCIYYRTQWTFRSDLKKANQLVLYF